MTARWWRWTYVRRRSAGKGAQVAGRAIADCVPSATQRGLDIVSAVAGEADLAGRYRQQIGDLPVYGGVRLVGSQTPAEEQVLERTERVRVQPGLDPPRPTARCW